MFNKNFKSKDVIAVVEMTERFRKRFWIDLYLHGISEDKLESIIIALKGLSEAGLYDNAFNIVFSFDWFICTDEEHDKLESSCNSYVLKALFMECLLETVEQEFERITRGDYHEADFYPIGKKVGGVVFEL